MQWHCVTAFSSYLQFKYIYSTGTVYYHPYQTNYATALKKKKPIFAYGKRRRRRSDRANDGYTPVTSHQRTELDTIYNGLISAVGTYVNLTYAPVWIICWLIRSPQAPAWNFARPPNNAATPTTTGAAVQWILVFVQQWVSAKIFISTKD